MTSLDEIKAIQIKYGVTPSTLGSSWDTIKKAAEGGRINPKYEFTIWISIWFETINPCLFGTYNEL